MRGVIILVILGIVLLLAGTFFTANFIPVEELAVYAEDHKFSGALLLAFLMFIATVVAPLTVLPVVPFVAPILGPLTTGFASYIGWSLGSITAFWLARTIGQPYVFRMVDKKSIEKTRKYVNEDTGFFFVLALKMTIPADSISYVLGLFTTISLRVYASATLLGLAWFSFAFAYLGDSLMEGNYVLFIPLGVASVAILYFFTRYIKKHQN